jgi:hypothetical protein
VAISFVGSLPAVSVFNGGNVTLTFSNFVDTAGSPVTLVENDVVVCCYTHNNGGDCSTSSSGWTEECDLASLSTRHTHFAVYTKRMGSTPDTSFVGVGPGGSSTGCAGVAMAFRGVDTTTMLDVAIVTSTGTASQKPDPGSITPTTSGAMVVVMGSGAATTGALLTNGGDLSSTTNEFRSGYTDENIDASIGMGIFRWTSGAFDPAQFGSTSSDAAEQAWAAAVIALRPGPLLDTISEGIGVAETVTAGLVYSDTLTDGSEITDFVTTGSQYTDTVADTVGTLEELAGGLQLNSTLDDTVSASYLIEVILAQPALAEAGVGVSPALVGSYGQVILEQLRIALTEVANHNFQLGLSDEVDLDPALTVGLPATVSDAINVAPTELVEQVIQIVEGLGLEPALAASALYNKTASEQIGVAVELLRFLGVDVSDAITVAEALAGVAAKLETVSEGIALAPTLTPQLLINVTASDTIEITAEDVLNFVLTGELSDGIELSAAYLSPGDSITTWVMNTRSGAVSEYTNFAFNSFAKFGHKYLGASDAGLFELIGDDDEGGVDITSRIKSGFAQWSNSRFTMFKGAYMAVRGGGDYVLKITTMDGKSYSYGVSARDGRTTKINIGKGLRARYFAFELISDGDDYELESLEFVPIVTDRRV